MPSCEYRNGELVEVPDLVIRVSGDCWDDVSQTLVIEPGVTLTTYGKLSGTVEVREAAKLDARNDVSGTVTVSSGAEVTFHRVASGTLNVNRGAVVTLTESAIAFGTMHIGGRLINQGTRGTNVCGAGVVDDLEGSTIRLPDETLGDGTVVYRY